MSSREERLKLAEEFSEECHDMFGAYLASIAAMDLANKEVVLIQKRKLAQYRYLGLRAVFEEVKQEPVNHLLERTGSDPQRSMFETTIGALEQNTAHEGPFYKLLGRMAVTFLYAIWQDRFRQRFADCAGLPSKEDFTHDLFGDLGKIRNHCVHGHGVASKQLEKLKVFPWFRDGDEIVISVERVDCFMLKIRKFCAEFVDPPASA